VFPRCSDLKPDCSTRRELTGGVRFYTFRHTCLPRWSAYLDPYTLAYFAGHSDFSTTSRYVHPNLNTAREAMERARNAQGGHTIGHTDETAESAASRGNTIIN
jgi:integrase